MNEDNELAELKLLMADKYHLHLRMLMGLRKIEALDGSRKCKFEERLQYEKEIKEKLNFLKNQLASIESEEVISAVKDESPASSKGKDLNNPRTFHVKCADLNIDKKNFNDDISILNRSAPGERIYKKSSNKTNPLAHLVASTVISLEQILFKIEFVKKKLKSEEALNKALVQMMDELQKTSVSHESLSKQDEPAKWDCSATSWLLYLSSSKIEMLHENLKLLNSFLPVDIFFAYHKKRQRLASNIGNSHHVVPDGGTIECKDKRPMTGVLILKITDINLSKDYSFSSEKSSKRDSLLLQVWIDGASGHPIKLKRSGGSCPLSTDGIAIDLVHANYLELLIFDKDAKMLGFIEFRLSWLADVTKTASKDDLEKGFGFGGSLNEEITLIPGGNVKIEARIRELKQFDSSRAFVESNSMEEADGGVMRRTKAMKRRTLHVMGHELCSMGGGASIFMKCANCHDMIYSGVYRCRKCHFTCHKSCAETIYIRCIADVRSFLKWEDLTSRLLKNANSHKTVPCVGKTKFCCHCGQLMMPKSVKSALGFDGFAASSTEHSGLSIKSKHHDFLSEDQKHNIFAYLNCTECGLYMHRECETFVPALCGLDRKMAISIVHQYRRESESEAALLLDNYKKEDHLIPPEFHESIRGTIDGTRDGSSMLRHKRLENKGEFDHSLYEMISMLGKGNFGKVLLAKEKLTGNMVALKVLKKNSIDSDDDDENFKAECAVFATIHGGDDAPFLIRCKRIINTNTRIIFVMEYVAGGDLMFHIQKKRRFTEDQAKFFAAETLLALEYLHQHNIIYRDLKLDNILLTLDGHIKLADYGLCKVGMTENATTRTFCGTTEFLAPEVLEEKPYTRAVDWWAFGVLLYELLCSRPPFYGHSEKEIFNSILHGSISFPEKISISVEAKDLICRLLIRQPCVRLCDSEIIKKHPFFELIDFDQLKQKKIPSPYMPLRMKEEDDVSNFDSVFTKEPPILTPCPTSNIKIISNIDGESTVEEEKFYDPLEENRILNQI